MMQTTRRTIYLISGYAVAYVLGQSLIKPIGPGSAAILYLVLALYSGLVIVIGGGKLRVVAVAICIASLLAFFVQRSDRERFERKMLQQLDMRRQEAVQDGKAIGVQKPSGEAGPTVNNTLNR